MPIVTTTETEIIDETQPEDCTMVSDLPAYIREDREALNILNSKLASACKAVQVVHGYQNVDVTGASLILLSTPVGNNSYITGLMGGQAGQQVELRVADTEDALEYPIVIQPDGVDFYTDDERNVELWENDWIRFQFCDATASEEICLRVLEGAWREIGRSQTRHPPGKAARYWVGVNEQGALYTEVI